LTLRQWDSDNPYPNVRLNPPCIEQSLHTLKRWFFSSRYSTQSTARIDGHQKAIQER